MQNIRLTRQFTFETAHALPDYSGPCRNIHGHSYRLQVTILGQPNPDTTDPTYGMVMDFGDLKKLVNELIVAPLDHALVLRADADKELVGLLQKLNHKIVLTSYQPTCEHMLIDFRNKLAGALPESIKLHSLRLWETENSFAEWYATDNT